MYATSPSNYRQDQVICLDAEVIGNSSSISSAAAPRRYSEGSISTVSRNIRTTTTPSSTSTPKNITFRDVTTKSANQVNKASGFLPLKSSNQSPADPSNNVIDVGDKKLVDRLYGQIETQDEALERLQFKYDQEKEARERMETEFQLVKDEMELTKKRFANYRKQEREIRTKSMLDKKERLREDDGRWEIAQQEITDLKKSLKFKNSKLAEFEFLCSNLQESLDRERGKGNADLEEAEKRLKVTSSMLEACYQKLSQAEQKLTNEAKMKEILIKINEALQHEVKRLQDAAATAAANARLDSVSFAQPLMQQPTRDLEDSTTQIIQDLQIEDALFYFEKVKKEYSDRPKVYRVFLEIIRDYKSRAISTPDVIARISKLFEGNIKLIVGFNRFLPKDYHINEDDAKTMNSYTGIAAKRNIADKKLHSSSVSVASSSLKTSMSSLKTSMTEETKPKQLTPPQQQQQHKDNIEVEQTKDNMTVVKVKQTNDDTTVIKVVVDQAQQKVKSGKKDVPPQKQSQKPPKKPKAKAESKQKQQQEKPSQQKPPPAASPKTVDLTKTTTLPPLESKLSKPTRGIDAEIAAALSITSSTLGKTPAYKSSSDSHFSEDFLSDDDDEESEEYPQLLAPVDNKKGSGVLTPLAYEMNDDDDGDNDVNDNDDNQYEDNYLGDSDFRNENQIEAVLEIEPPPSPTKAEINTGSSFNPFTSFNLSVDSSQIFSGIETMQDSFGVAMGMLSNAETTLYNPTDRYEIIEDDEFNGIEVFADPRGRDQISDYWV